MPTSFFDCIIFGKKSIQNHVFSSKIQNDSYQVSSSSGVDSSDEDETTPSGGARGRSQPSANVAPIISSPEKVDGKANAVPNSKGKGGKGSVKGVVAAPPVATLGFSNGRGSMTGQSETSFASPCASTDQDAAFKSPDNEKVAKVSPSNSFLSPEEPAGSVAGKAEQNAKDSPIKNRMQDITAGKVTKEAMLISSEEETKTEQAGDKNGSIEEKSTMSTTGLNEKDGSDSGKSDDVALVGEDATAATASQRGRPVHVRACSMAASSHPEQWL